MRPKDLENYVGQDKAVGKESMLYSLLSSDHIPSIILWGPPGCGKVMLMLIYGIGKHFILAVTVGPHSVWGWEPLGHSKILTRLVIMFVGGEEKHAVLTDIRLQWWPSGCGKIMLMLAGEKEKHCVLAVAGPHSLHCIRIHCWDLQAVAN